CPACQRPVFILPASAWPAPRRDSGDVRRAPASRLTPWLWPVTGAVVTLIGVAAIFIVVTNALSRRSPEHAHQEAPNIDGRIAAGKKALAARSFHEATKQFEGAEALREKQPQLVSAKETRELRQLHRQASLLADLHLESLEELLRHAAGMPDAEWQARFHRNYEGRAVVFDALARRDAADRYHVEYWLSARGEPGRVECGELHLLQALPLRDPHRLIFGARLASIRREKNAAWVVRFKPDSGVLLTDRGAVSASFLRAIDAELEEALRWQEA